MSLEKVSNLFKGHYFLGDYDDRKRVIGVNKAR
jgi:hypothetical protein